MNEFKSVRYNSIGVYLKEHFGERIVKLSLDGGYTCPNRDGSKGIGGCTFCLEGSGRFAGNIVPKQTAGRQTSENATDSDTQGPREKSTARGQLTDVYTAPKQTAGKPENNRIPPILDQMEAQTKLVSRKWPDAKYLAYFQSFTNTYAPVSKLKSQWDEALSYPGCVGLAVATRPDCLPDDVIALLDDYSRKTYLWAELGLQSAREDTGELVNRCCTNAEYEAAAKKLGEHGIKYVAHLILGLPGESRDDMLSSVRYALKFKPFGLKLHMLHIMKGTKMADDYEKEPFSVLSLEDYVSLVCDILEIIPPEVTIHRLTGDAPGDALIEPEWAKNKHTVLNSIQQELKRRGSYQGRSICE